MQNSIRTFQDGMLKPDAFAEDRLLGQPPGVCVMLVMYNRFHNYVVENLALINEGGRFTLPKKDDPRYEELLTKRDNDLFQTGRL
jgi:linoleate 10R-lipoxygenase